MNLSSTIKSIQDIMRKDAGVDGDAQRIGQLTWMLFLKIFDQREEEWEKDAAKRGERYRSPLPEECRWRNWASLNNDGVPKIPAQRLVDYINNRVFPQLKELNINVNDERAKVICEVFKDSNNYMRSGALMQSVIERLNDAIDFHNFKTRQHLGDIYEQLLNDLRSAGNAGEFYTPRAITKFMVQMVNPRLGRREVVLDPACGTGGFLTATIDWLEQQSKDGLNEEEQKKTQQAIASCIRGIEKKQLPHLLCTTNMLLHGIDVPSMIEHRNTLAIRWHEWQPSDQVDCVITNPPFGGQEEEDVGHDYPSPVRTRETADMFLVLIVEKLLKDNGGRGAVVLPDGNLFGEGIKAKVKAKLLDECNLHTIIRLPAGVFNPYTGIKTNLLFFTKGQPTETIWFYEHRYPEGVRSYSKTKPLRLEELQPIAEWWGNESDGFADRRESNQAWTVDFKALKEDAESKAKPHKDKADAFNAEVSTLTRRIKEIREEIKGEKQEEVRLHSEMELAHLYEQCSTLRQKAKEEQLFADRYHWSVYNLDIKNPNVLEENNPDAEKLIKKYKKLLKELENTRTVLRNELASALSHQLENEGSIK